MDEWMDVLFFDIGARIKWTIQDIWRTYIPGEISDTCRIYVRTISAKHLTRDICLKKDICLFQGGHAHMQFSLRFLAVTLTACVRGHLEKDIYPS